MTARSLSRRSRVVIYGLGGIVTLVVLLYVMAWIDGDVRVFTLKRQGNEVRDRIEAYRTAHGTLPPDLDAAGVPQTSQENIYYRQDGTDYILWFGMELGESVTYSSKTKKWDD